jgi:hypothetical protein
MEIGKSIENNVGKRFMDAKLVMWSLGFRWTSENAKILELTVLNQTE